MIELLSTKGVRACDVLVDDWIEIGGDTYRVIDIGKVSLNLNGLDHVILVLHDEDKDLESDSILQVFLPTKLEITIKNQVR